MNQRVVIWVALACGCTPAAGVGGDVLDGSETSAGSSGPPSTTEGVSTSGPGTNATSTADGSSAAEDTTAATTAAEDGTATDATTGPAMCPEPGEIACMPKGEANATLTVMPELLDDFAATCTVVTTTDAAPTQTVVLDCDGSEITIAVESFPHLPIALGDGQSVTLDLHVFVDITSLPFFSHVVLRDADDALLFAALHVPENGLEPEPQAALAPLAYASLETDCEAEPGQICDTGGVLPQRRTALRTSADAAELVLTDGNSGTLETASANFGVIVSAAAQAVCWPEECAVENFETLTTAIWVRTP